MPPMIDPDHVPYLRYFLAGLAVALVVGAGLFARGRSRPSVERLALFLCPAAAYLSLTLAALKVVQAPDNDWEAARLAPAVGLLSGAKIYVGPGGAGALMGTTSPPVAYLAYAPAGLFGRVTHAIIAGSCISLALYLAPAAVLGFWPGRGGSTLLGVACLVVLLQASLASKSLAFAAFNIHAEAPTLAFAALAALPLYLRRGGVPTSQVAYLASAGFASMAIWSELAAWPAVAALPVWVFATRGVREAFRYSLALLLALASSTLLFRSLFGDGSFAFSVVELPGRHPWIYEGPKFVDGLLMASAEFTCGIAAIAGSLILAAIVRRTFTPADAGDPEVETVGFRPRLARNPWLLFVLMALATIPASLANRLSFGGYLNNYALPFYLLMMGLVALLREWHEANRRLGLVSLNASLTLGLLLLALSPLTCSEESFRVFSTLHRPTANVQEVAYRFSKRHPGRAYFPWNPLSNLLGEGKLYDFDYALLERESAGCPVGGRHVLRNLPETLRFVCYPPYMKSFGPQFEQALKHLPEFGRPVEVRELPGWTCYERTRAPGG